MKYPALIVNKAKLRHNTQQIVKMCKESGIQVAGVTKAFCGDPSIAEILLEGGIRTLADSRIDNLKKLRFLKASKMLLRIPMLSELSDVVEFADISLNSELKTIEALSKLTLQRNKKHEVIVMIDLGDLREGILAEEALDFVGKVLKLEGIILKGIGVNLNCYGSVIPTSKNLTLLTDIATDIEKEYHITLEIISGGNSGSLHLLKDNKVPDKINHLRIGEAILLGKETSYQKEITGMHTDVFTFSTEIVELKEKPSVPFGDLGLNAFGRKPVFQDEGIIKRAIIACGRQDVLCEQLRPRDLGIKFIGASSDHMILNVTHANKTCQLGDPIDFDMSYGGILDACTSEYVDRVII